MYCLKSLEERQAIHIVLVFQNAAIFTFHPALNIIKSNFMKNMIC